MITATDKSNRLCVTKASEMIVRTEEILKDRSTYKPINKSKKNSLEKQANTMINNIFKDNLSKSNLQRLHVSGSQPSNFYALIKDHKREVNVISILSGLLLRLPITLLTKLIGFAAVF